MKLISCYVENFGGLSQYSLDFSQGLTVICQPNGFGKTTLAEFIRAMFYGFPRAAKKAEKNLRKKYLPWQGGKCGGHLIFEHQGKRYRIDRTFGDTPRSDTFTLTDPDTHKKCKDFSEDIGKELFGLDSDSFERSTYAPQRQEMGPLSSANIRAKLGNLLEDTEDVGRYDKAVEALRAKRSSYIPFKGSSGTVEQTRRRISETETALDETRRLVPRLQAATEQLCRERQNRSELTQRLESLRKERTAAARYEAAQAIHTQYQNLCRSRNDCREQLDAFSRKYPAGLPRAAQLEEMDTQAAFRRTLMTQQTDSPADNEAEMLAEKNRSRFSAGIPDADTFDEMRRCSTAYIEAQSRINSAQPTPEAAACLKQLQALFASGVPKEETIAQWRDMALQLAALPDGDAPALTPEEALREQNLQIFFAPGVPGEEDIAKHQSLADRAAALRQESVAIAAALEDRTRHAPPPPKAKQLPIWLPLVLGLVLAGAGVGLLVMSVTGAGAAVLGLGVVMLLAGLFWKLKGDLRKEFSAAPAMTESERQQISQNNARAAQLEQSVLDFVSVYISDSRSLSQKLAAISGKREQYLALKQKREDAQNRSQQIHARRMGLTAALEQQLAPYSPAGETLSAQIDTLAHQIHTFSHLAAQEEARQKRLREAEQALSLLQTRLSDFLLPYFPQGLPEDLSGAVSQLELDCRAYRDAVARVEERNRRRAKRAEDLAACDEKLKEFWQTYRLTQDPREPEVLATLRKDLQQFTLLHTELERYERAEKAFRLEHAALLEQPLDQGPGDTQALAQLESQLTEQLSAAEKAIASGEQEQRTLASQVDTIPELEDQLIRLRESMEADIRRSQLLDQTLTYLQEAKDSLTTRYLGPIQGYFQDYLHRITGEEQKNIAISTELEVTLSRRGQQRAMVNFSAGQADIVWICMHLALADAMFQEDGSPIILDDPFVNLDDRNLDQALELLKDLATSHQILYLTCHTGRTHPD